MARTTISMQQLDKFSVDEQTAQLFWNDREVMTVMSLPWWVQWAALVAAAGTALSGFAAIVAVIFLILDRL